MPEGAAKPPAGQVQRGNTQPPTLPKRTGILSMAARPPYGEEEIPLGDDDADNK
ncbi:MAG: hypothetical protein ACRCV5_11085 [Afipia sp.]